MRHFLHFLYGILLVLATGCFEEDLPVPPYESPEGVADITIPMGPIYDKQFFFDLSTQTIVKTVSRDEWDLAFEAGPDESQIFLNSARFMRVVKFENADFESITSVPSSAEWVVDAPSGHRDSLAMRNWAPTTVYVLDMGYTPGGALLGRKKFQCLSVNNSGYTVRVANMNNSLDTVITVHKKNDRNHVYLKIHGSEPFPDIEPSKASWDLLFTQYTSRVFNNSSQKFEDYSVNGVLLNPYQVEAARAFQKPFMDISYTDLENYTFSKARDIIGYDWKWYDFDGETYLVDVNKSYIVKDTEGFYYKLRFIGFMNNAGQKGYPRMELAKF